MLEDDGIVKVILLAQLWLMFTYNVTQLGPVQ
jgi:hypothetical protein